MSSKKQDQEVTQTNPTPSSETPVTLEVEELEPVVTPRLSANHNENIVAIRLEAEELEAVIVPKLSANHNETVLH